jgi:hypothetical protein
MHHNYSTRTLDLSLLAMLDAKSLNLVVVTLLVIVKTIYSLESKSAGVYGIDVIQSNIHQIPEVIYMEGRVE